MVYQCVVSTAWFQSPKISEVDDTCVTFFQSQSTVQMIMEISPQYHSLVLGAQQQNLKTIMQHTGVQVMFPDPSDPYTPSLKRSSVVISGPINKVYLARQMLIVSFIQIFQYVFISINLY